MFRAAVLLALASVLLAALALISCLSVEDKRQIRGMPRFAWLLVILLVPLGGSVAWFLAGRPRPIRGRDGNWRAATGLPEPRRPQAPDDDPEFLRSLDQHTGHQPPSQSEPDPPASSEPADDDLLHEWEQDLKRREEEQRRRDSGTEG